MSLPESDAAVLFFCAIFQNAQYLLVRPWINDDYRIVFSFFSHSKYRLFRMNLKDLNFCDLPRKLELLVFKKINHRYAWNSCTIWTSSEGWLFRRNVKKMNQISRQKNQCVGIKDVQISTLETLITERMPEKITKKDQFNLLQNKSQIIRFHFTPLSPVSSLYSISLLTLKFCKCTQSN